LRFFKWVGDILMEILQNRTMDTSNIRRPTLLVDVKKAKKNIAKMAQLASSLGIPLRPHFKTPQSLQAGEWYREAGVDCITVSSVTMAAYFMEGGWRDIIIAFPVNLRELPLLNDLSSKGKIGLILDSVEVAKQLSAGLLHAVDIWIEVDCGQNRSGVPVLAKEQVLNLAQALDKLPHLRFAGILSHAGHSYQARGKAAILEVHAQALADLQSLKLHLIRKGFPHAKLSYGDTPTCSVAANFEEVDELRPGNFVFYDLMQEQIGACVEEQVAVALACPVVAVYPERGIAILHGGAVHLSKDFLVDPMLGQHFGKIALPAMGGWTTSLPGSYLKSLSQEHGVAVLSKELIPLVHPGDLLMALPVHSCLCADLMGGWMGSDGMWYEMMPRPGLGNGNKKNTG
jgi:D-serine deaminase-like pyridoxal phosphate-dependent protein